MATGYHLQKNPHSIYYTIKKN